MESTYFLSLFFRRLCIMQNYYIVELCSIELLVLYLPRGQVQRGESVLVRQVDFEGRLAQ